MFSLYVPSQDKHWPSTFRFSHTAEIKKKLKINLTYVNAEREFLRKLSNISDPEKKRKIIGNLFIKIFVKPVGGFVSGSKASYIYLSQTIPRFYFAEELSDILRIAGFNEVSYRKLSLGIAAREQRSSKNMKHSE